MAATRSIRRADASCRTAFTICFLPVASSRRRSSPMTDMQTAERLLAAPPTRGEYLRDVVASRDIGVVEKPLTLVQQIVNQAWLRKAFILVVIATAWQLYALHIDNPLMVPTFSATLDAWQAGIVGGDLPVKVGTISGLSMWSA